MIGVNFIVKVFLFLSNSTYMTPSITACETEKAFDDAQEIPKFGLRGTIIMYLTLI